MPKEAKKPLPEGLRSEDFQTTAEDAPLEAGTLSGDLRDVMLTHVRSMTVPWAMMGEDEQRDKIYAISRACEDIVRRAVETVVKAGFPSVVVSVGAIKIDKGVEVKLSAPSSVETINRLAEHGKGSAVLVLAEASDFYGERSAAKPDKDQPDLPLDDDGGSD